MAKTERIVIEFIPNQNGKTDVVFEYFPVTPESGRDAHQAALELAIAALIGKALSMRRELGQRIPIALMLAEEARTFRDFY